MPAACNAAAQVGAHKSITAAKHTHAPSLVLGALESWRILFIFQNLKNTPPATLRKSNSPNSPATS